LIICRFLVAEFSLVPFNDLVRGFRSILRSGYRPAGKGWFLVSGLLHSKIGQEGSFGVHVTMMAPPMLFFSGLATSNREFSV